MTASGTTAADGVGLSSARARALLEQVGPNTVPEHGTHPLLRLAGKFWAPVPWMLEATVALETALGKWLDASIVAVVLVLNAGIGFAQEGRAQAAVEQLRHRLAIEARVRRDGIWGRRPAAELVPGDLVHVRMGDLVPADLRLSSGNVLIDQSTLTGESVPVEHVATEQVYAGAVVARGEATGQVTATGTRTYFGHAAELVSTSHPPAHLEGVVFRIVAVFIGLDLLLAATGTGYLLATGAAGADVVGFAVVLLLASVPVALPAAFALAGALGAQHLARIGILTTRLTTLQQVAGMDILCVDKTGTITQNRLAVAEVRAFGHSVDEVLQWAAAASDPATQDPLDLAILHATDSHPSPPLRRSAFVPFDPQTKRSEATITSTAGPVRVTKGAPQTIAALAGQPVDPAVDELAATGARVLGVAVTGGDGWWQQAGLIALADPPRADAADLIRRLHNHDVRVVMLTGDATPTAAAVATTVGIPGAVVPAAALHDPAFRLGDVGVVAEVLPEDKHHLICRLQDDGHGVGMTGDGVNDAPALRQADVGIAVASATDVAKSAAGVVLTNEGLADIVGLIEESRRIHQRSLSYALNVSVKKLEIPILLSIGVFAWRQFVFTPLLMALLLLANDVVSMTITTDRARISGHPDLWAVRRLITGAVIVAAPLLTASTLLLWIGKDGGPHLDLAGLRSLMLLTLVTSSQASIYLVRTRDHAWTDPPARPLALATAAAVTAAIALTATGTLVQHLSVTVITLALATVLISALIADLIKVPTWRALGLHRR